MTLAAAQVVDAVAARLIPMAATGGRVFTSRTWPLAEAELPAWRVTAGDEQVSAAGLDVNAPQQHELDVEAAVVARATADLDDALHALAESGLSLLFATQPPHALLLMGIRRGLQGDGEAALGVLQLRLRALFFTVPSAPGTIVSS